MAAQLPIHAVANQTIRHLSRHQLVEALTIRPLVEALAIRPLVEALAIQPLVEVPMIQQMVEPLTTLQPEVTQTIQHLQVKIQPALAMTYMLRSLSLDSNSLLLKLI